MLKVLYAIDYYSIPQRSFVEKTLLSLGFEHRMKILLKQRLRPLSSRQYAIGTGSYLLLTQTCILVRQGTGLLAQKISIWLQSISMKPKTFKFGRNGLIQPNFKATPKTSIFPYYQLFLIRRLILRIPARSNPLLRKLEHIFCLTGTVK